MPRTSRPMRTTRRWLPLWALLACATCDRGSTTLHYDAAHDDVAMALIASSWVGVDGSTVSICEDVAKADAETTDACVVEHVVRGGGRGVQEDGRHRDGSCGGCIHIAKAFVRGSVLPAPGAEPLAVSGDVELVMSGSDDAYAVPYRLSVECKTPGQTCYLLVKLSSDGRLTGDLVVGVPATPQAVTTHVSMTRVGPADCSAVPDAPAEPAEPESPAEAGGPAGAEEGRGE